MKHFLTVFISLIFFVSTHAQISVQNILGFSSFNTSNNSQLANMIQGAGVQVTNINYTGDTNSIGVFHSGDSIIGISSGIALTTGNFSYLSIPTNDSPTSSVNTSGGSDPDLDIIANAPTFDASILELDFVPSGDTVEFQMVFASEEYPEYVCVFNDVFGFLVSGDGYNGGYSNGAENVALIPNTNDAIGINTVNGGVAAGSAQPCVTTNTNYYIDNPAVTTGGPSNYPIYFDGFTTVITVKFAVTPDSTYHLKMAIADAFDAFLDSGIFLKAKSLSSNGGNLSTTTELVVSTSLGNGWTNEQCGSFELGVTYPSPLTEADTLEIITAGTAINNVDYINMPDTLIGNIGDTAIQSTIVGIISDLIFEATEDIHIYMKRGGVIIDSTLVYITDSSVYQLDIQDEIICESDTVVLDATFPFNNNIHTFTNNTQMNIPDNSPVPTISKINVPGVPTNLYLESVCVNISHLLASDIDLFLVSPSLEVIELSTDNGIGSNYNLCFTKTATASITNYTGGMYGEYIPEQSLSLLDGTQMSGEWSLVVFDDNSFFTGTLDDWTLTFTTNDDLQYSWSPSTGLDCDTCSVVNASPDSTTNYVVTVTNLTGCSITDTIEVTVLPRTQFSLLPCSNIGDSTITFNWQTDGTETNTEISFDNGLSWTTLGTGVYSYTLNNLLPGTPYTMLLKCENQNNCLINPLVSSCLTTGCQSATFTINSVNATDSTLGNITIIPITSTGGVHYLWNTGDTTATIDNLTAGIYNVTITDSNNCPISTEIVICGTITPIITTTPDSGFINLGMIDVSIQGGVPPFSYQWNNGSTGNSLSGLLSGTYGAMITDSLNCKHFITTTVSDLVSNYDLKTVEHLSISPNPTADLVNIQMTLTQASSLRIYVRDITGKLLGRQIRPNSSQHQTVFDLSAFPNGTYIIQLEVNDEIVSKRVILQR